MRYHFENYTLVEREDDEVTKRWSLSDFVKLYEKCENMKIVDIIKAEKEAQKLSYFELAKMISKENLHYMEPHNGVIKCIEEDIRQILRNKTPNLEVIKALCKVLDIEDTIEKRLTTLLYKEQNSDSCPGRLSETRKKENQENYLRIQNNVTNKETPLIQTAIVSGLSESIFYDGEWIEPDLYNALIEEKKEINILKHSLLIYRKFPDLIQTFLNNFEMEDEDIKELEKMKIEITC